jgi:hypothetical protein
MEVSVVASTRQVQAAKQNIQEGTAGGEAEAHDRRASEEHASR